MPNYATALARGWLLHNSSGGELIYSGQRMVNPANADYQGWWNSSADSYFAANPTVDGFFVDNFVQDFKNFPFNYPVYDQSNVLLWSTQTDFKTAQLSFSNACH